MNPMIRLMKLPPLLLIAFALGYFALSPAVAVFPTSEAQSPSDLGGCTVIADGNRLSIIGNETANIIEIVGSESGVQVACDGVADTFTGVEELTVEAGDGDDQIGVDDTNGLLGGIHIAIFGGAGNETHTLNISDTGTPRDDPSQVGLIGGPGEDALTVISPGALDERFDIASDGPEANSVEMQVTDIETETPLANITGSDLEVLTVEAGDGDDLISTVSINGLLGGIALFNMLKPEGSGLFVARYVDSNNKEGGEPIGYNVFGMDIMLISSGLGEDKFDIAPGRQASSVDVQLTAVPTQTAVAHIRGSELEELTVKGGDGNDEFNVASLQGIVQYLFGEADLDIVLDNLPLDELIEPSGEPVFSDGGSGVDKFILVGTSANEDYQIRGVPDQTTDPEIRVTDLVTGNVTADVHVQQTEEIMVDAVDGDDRVEVNWDAALMSGLSLIRADLGRGNDMFVSNLLPVLSEPPTREVQTARFELDGGSGSDQVSFSHSAGSWFDVSFTVDTGAGTDTVNALLFPPPDDGIPGPGGLRQLQFDVGAGGNDDFVGLQNRTNGEFFDVFLEAVLGGGNDTFEGTGEINDANILPARGFDTARVTRNLLPFVTEFERVEILE